jgi:cob(I)alamin adenosyltransferase
MNPQTRQAIEIIKDKLVNVISDVETERDEQSEAGAERTVEFLEEELDTLNSALESLESL